MKPRQPLTLGKPPASASLMLELKEYMATSSEFSLQHQIHCEISLMAMQLAQKEITLSFSEGVLGPLGSAASYFCFPSASNTSKHHHIQVSRRYICNDSLCKDSVPAISRRIKTNLKEHS